MAGADDNTVITEMGDGPPSSPGESNPCVVLLHSGEEGLLPRRYPLEKTPVRMGRDPDAEVLLEGESVSRRHAHLERRGERWWIVDEGSKNGTYVNDQQINPDVVLNNGDLFKVGPNILKYLSGADAEARYHEEDLQTHDLGRPDSDLQQALPRGDARARDHPRAPTRAAPGVRDAGHRLLQEGQRQPWSPCGRLRAPGAGQADPGSRAPRGNLRALRRRGVRHFDARDDARGGGELGRKRAGPSRCPSLRVPGGAHSGHGEPGCGRAVTGSGRRRVQQSQWRWPTRSSTRPSVAAATAFVRRARPLL